jgi:hypothetical protein
MSQAPACILRLSRSSSPTPNLRKRSPSSSEVWTVVSAYRASNSPSADWADLPTP